MQARHTMIHINEKTPSCQIYILLKYMSVAPGSDSFFFSKYVYDFLHAQHKSLCCKDVNVLYV